MSRNALSAHSGTGTSKELDEACGFKRITFLPTSHSVPPVWFGRLVWHILFRKKYYVLLVSNAAGEVPGHHPQSHPCGALPNTEPMIRKYKSQPTEPQEIGTLRIS
eukprot:5547251-Amphidinium_carterae.1